MIGISWKGIGPYRFGAVEIWEDGIVVATECNGHSVISPKLTDREQIKQIYFSLGDWLVATNPELSDPS
jgi:hypothetical protein